MKGVFRQLLSVRSSIVQGIFTVSKTLSKNRNELVGVALFVCFFL